MSFDSARHAIVLHLRVHERWDADDAIRAERQRRTDARYAGRAASSVPPEEREIYARYLVARAHDRSPTEETLGALIDLDAVLEGPTRKPVRDAIFSYVGRDFQMKPKAISVGAKERFVAWTRRAEPTFEDDEYTRFLSIVFSDDITLPGIDPLSYAWSAFDAWVALGRPILPPHSPDQDVSKLPRSVREIVCPGTYVSGRSFYEFLSHHPDAEGKFATELRARNDASLRTIALENLFTSSIQWETPVFRAFGDDPDLWANTVLLLSKAHLFLIESQTFDDELLRVWKDDPEHRARRLSVLCQTTSDAPCYRTKVLFCLRTLASAESASYRAVVRTLPVDRQKALRCDER